MYKEHQVLQLFDVLSLSYIYRRSVFQSPILMQYVYTVSINQLNADVII